MCIPASLPLFSSPHFGLEKLQVRSCERQCFGVMVVCCGADMMATKVGEAKPVIMQRLVEEMLVVVLNAWCLSRLVLGCLTKISDTMPKSLVLIPRCWMSDRMSETMSDRMSGFWRNGIFFAKLAHLSTPKWRQKKRETLLLGLYAVLIFGDARHTNPIYFDVNRKGPQIDK